MEFSRDDAKNIVKAFWWVVLIAAVLGCVLGFFYGNTTEKTTYKSTAQLIVDIDKLEEDFTDNSGTPNFQAGYNTAHSLIATFEKIIFNEETVLLRVSESYYEETGILYEPAQLKNKFAFSHETNTLVVDVSCTASTKEECETLIRLLCKHGIERLNTLSGTVYIDVSSIDIYSYTFDLKYKSAKDVDAFKSLLEDKNDEIYDHTCDKLYNIYLQRNEIRNGFKFVDKGNGVLEVSYSNTKSEVVDYIVKTVLPDYVQDAGLEYVDWATLSDPQKAPDKEPYEEISEAKGTFSSNKKLYILVFAFFAVVISALVVTFIYLVKNDRIKFITKMKENKKEKADNKQKDEE